MDDQLIADIEELCISFETSSGRIEAVKSLNFTLKKGETVAIVGESGSGKSVTSLSLVRLVENGGGKIEKGKMQFRRRSGEVTDLVTMSDNDMREIRGNEIAMIFQEPMTSLNPVFTVGDQIIEAIRTHRTVSQTQAHDIAVKMLETVRIPDAVEILRRHPHQLSGGMRQRVMIAMALCCQPQLLIADEPTTALDVTVQAQILRLLKSIQAEYDMSVLFITHDMGVVAEIADRVVVMYRGEKVEEGLVADIFANPQHPYTQNLLAAAPRLGSMQGISQPRPFGAQSSLQEDEKKEASGAKSAKTKPLLSVRGLTTRFDIEKSIFGKVRSRVHAVEKLNFDLWPKETLAIVGESGCGKSTTGRSILRLVEAQCDQLIFDGQDLTNISQREMQILRKNIQLIFQDPYASLNPRLTIGFSIAEPMLVHKTAEGADVDDRVAWLLEKVGLSPDSAQRYPHEFSGGQRQRICIARALSTNPKLIIADEAVSALDVSIQAQIINLMMELQQQFDLSFLFISHDMAVVERISHRVAVMYLGQIVEIGTRQQIFENPQHPYTKHLLTAAPVPDPGIARKNVALDLSEVPSPIRSVDNAPQVHPLVLVETGHLVAKHSVGGRY